MSPRRRALLLYRSYEEDHYTQDGAAQIIALENGEKKRERGKFFENGEKKREWGKFFENGEKKRERGKFFENGEKKRERGKFFENGKKIRPSDVNVLNGVNLDTTS